VRPGRERRQREQDREADPKLEGGNATMQAASATAICGNIPTTSGPSSPSESTIGRMSAADEDDIKTAYNAV
jgi:hypothetical protein